MRLPSASKISRTIRALSVRIRVVHRGFVAGVTVQTMRDNWMSMAYKLPWDLEKIARDVWNKAVEKAMEDMQ